MLKLDNFTFYMKSWEEQLKLWGLIHNTWSNGEEELVLLNTDNENKNNS